MLAGIPDEFVIGAARGDSLMPYVGSKARFKHVFDAILPDDPDRVVDVFGGSGAFSLYACRRYGAERVHYNDAAPAMANLMRSVQSSPREVFERWEFHSAQHSRDYFLETRETNLEDGVDAAARTLYLASNSFSGLLLLTEDGSSMAGPSSHASARADWCRLESTSAIIQGMAITNHDYREFWHEDSALVYLDPPYFLQRSSHYYYGGHLDLDEFKWFLAHVSLSNDVVLSEQQSPDFFGMDWEWRPVATNHSLSTGDPKREIIAWNWTQ